MWEEETRASTSSPTTQPWPRLTPEEVIPHTQDGQGENKHLLTHLLLWCAAPPRATSPRGPGCCDRPPWPHTGCGAPGPQWGARTVGCSRSGCGSSYLGPLRRTPPSVWPVTFRWNKHNKLKCVTASICFYSDWICEAWPDLVGNLFYCFMAQTGRGRCSFSANGAKAKEKTTSAEQRHVETSFLWQKATGL